MFVTAVPGSWAIRWRGVDVWALLHELAPEHDEVDLRMGLP